MFKSYTPPIYSSNEEYINYIKHSLPDHSLLTELCSNCGYPAGRHYSKKCPTQEQLKTSFSFNRIKIYPEFPVIALNKIKII